MVTRPVAEGLLRIRNGEEFTHLLAWLKKRSEEARDACTTQTGEALYRAQGRAQERKDLLDFIDGAPGTLERLRNQK